MTKQTSIKISIILGVILIAVLSVILIGYTKVRGIEIDVQYPSNLVIIQKNDIEQTLKKQYGDLLSYKRNQIDKDDIQLTLESNNFVHSVFVSMSPSGILRITVKQKILWLVVSIMKALHITLMNKAARYSILIM